MNPLARAASLITRHREEKRYTTAELLPAYRDNRPMFKDWDTETAIKEGYRASVWVYTCVYRLMKDVASVPWIAEVRKGEKLEPDPKSPLTELIEHPNESMDRQDMMERFTAHLHDRPSESRIHPGERGAFTKSSMLVSVSCSTLRPSGRT